MPRLPPRCQLIAESAQIRIREMTGLLHLKQSPIGGADERTIMKHTGHRSVQMVRRYMRDASLFRDNPATKAGLYNLPWCLAKSRCP